MSLLSLSFAPKHLQQLYLKQSFYLSQKSSMGDKVKRKNNITGVKYFNT